MIHVHIAVSVQTNGDGWCEFSKMWDNHTHTLTERERERERERESMCIGARVCMRA